MEYLESLFRMAKLLLYGKLRYSSFNHKNYDGLKKMNVLRDCLLHPELSFSNVNKSEFF